MAKTAFLCEIWIANDQTPKHSNFLDRDLLKSATDLLKINFTLLV